MHYTACGTKTYPDASCECGPVEEFVAEDEMTHGFRHLDVVLAVRADRSGPSRFCASLAILGIERPEFALAWVDESSFRAADKSTEIRSLAPGGANSVDPVIREFLSVSAAVKSVDGRHADMYADDMRLASFARLLSSRSEAQQFSPRAGGSAKRRMGALQKWHLKRSLDYIDEHLADRITLVNCGIPPNRSLSHVDMIAGSPCVTVKGQPAATTMWQKNQRLVKREFKRKRHADNGISRFMS